MCKNNDILCCVISFCIHGNQALQDVTNNGTYLNKICILVIHRHSNDHFSEQIGCITQYATKCKR